MGFFEASKHCMSKWITFSGRAQRSEFWWFALFYLIASIVFQVAMTVAAAGGSTAGMVIGLASLIPLIFLLVASISVSVRRLHDKDKSGWWYWISLVPIVGAILLLVWFCQRGTAGPNRFGTDPLMGTDAEVFA